MTRRQCRLSGLALPTEDPGADDGFRRGGGVVHARCRTAASRVAALEASGAVDLDSARRPGGRKAGAARTAAGRRHLHSYSYITAAGRQGTACQHPRQANDRPASRYRRGAAPRRQAGARPWPRPHPQLCGRDPGAGTGDPAPGACAGRAPPGRPAADRCRGRLRRAHDRGAPSAPRRPSIAKEARVKEEVSLRKTAEERTETVRDTVRHTEVRGGGRPQDGRRPDRQAGADKERARDIWAGKAGETASPRPTIASGPGCRPAARATTPAGTSERGRRNPSPSGLAATLRQRRRFFPSGGASGCRAEPGGRRMRTQRLTILIMVGMVLGIAVGHFCHSSGRTRRRRSRSPATSPSSPTSSCG